MKLGPMFASLFRFADAADPDFRHRLQAQLEETFSPQGFEPGASGIWVRSKGTPWRQVVQIAKLKTQACSLLWGMSFDFAPMPNQALDKLTWHRTVKTAVPMLIDDPIDTWTHETDPELRVMSMEGARANAKTAKRLVELAAHGLKRMQTLDDAIAAFDNWKTRPFVRFGYHNYWKAPIVHAFCLGKAGQKAEASAMIEEWIGSHPHAAPAVVAKLREELEKL